MSWVYCRMSWTQSSNYKRNLEASALMSKKLLSWAVLRTRSLDIETEFRHCGPILLYVCPFKLCGFFFLMQITASRIHWNKFQSGQDTRGPFECNVTKYLFSCLNIHLFSCMLQESRALKLFTAPLIVTLHQGCFMADSSYWMKCIATSLKSLENNIFSCSMG
jgi:hypothetical protein